MKLHDLSLAVGSTHVGKRKGRGPGTGNGKTAGRGHKGQKARSGGGVRVGFLNGVINVTGMMSMVVGAPYLGFALALFGVIGRSIAEVNLFPYALLWFATSFPVIAMIWAGYRAGYEGKFMSRFKKK